MDRRSDIDLLRLEIETLWVVDGRGRLLHSNETTRGRAPLLVIAVAGGEQAVALGADVPNDLELDLLEAIDRSTPAVNPREQPTSLELCRDLIKAALGPNRIVSGPTYVVSRPPLFDSGAVIHTSASANLGALRDKRPAGAWTVEEWDELLAGQLGPVAVATVEASVAAVCHTSRSGARAVEAGVWTDPQFRGRGHAVAVTSAWASLFDRDIYTLFYSTSADNLASRRVAAKLGLREVGWTWTLRPL